VRAVSSIRVKSIVVDFLSVRHEEGHVTIHTTKILDLLVSDVSRQACSLYSSALAMAIYSESTCDLRSRRCCRSQKQWARRQCRAETVAGTDRHVLMPPLFTLLYLAGLASLKFSTAAFTIRPPILGAKSLLAVRSRSAVKKIRGVQVSRQSSPLVDDDIGLYDTEGDSTIATKDSDSSLEESSDATSDTDYVEAKAAEMIQERLATNRTFFAGTTGTVASPSPSNDEVDSVLRDLGKRLETDLSMLWHVHQQDEPAVPLEPDAVLDTPEAVEPETMELAEPGQAEGDVSVVQEIDPQTLQDIKFMKMAVDVALSEYVLTRSAWCFPTRFISR
jgi:hypothetical protein